MGHEQVVGTLLRGHGLTLATAESLTGGQVGQLVTSVSGASAYYLGGVICYATGAKEKVLGVDPTILAAHGPVSRETAVAMAARIRELFGASVGLSTTGVAGPDQQDGHPVGTLHIGVADATGATCVSLRGPAGSRSGVRSWAADQALRVLADRLRSA